MKSSRNRRTIDRANPTWMPGELRGCPPQEWCSAQEWCSPQERGPRPARCRDLQSRDHNPFRARQRKPMGPPRTGTRP